MDDFRSMVEIGKQTPSIFLCLFHFFFVYNLLFIAQSNSASINNNSNNNSNRNSNTNAAVTKGSVNQNSKRSSSSNQEKEYRR